MRAAVSCSSVSRRRRSSGKSGVSFSNYGPLAGDLRVDAVDVVDLEQRVVLLVVLGLAHLAVDLVAAAQTEAADLRQSHVDVLVALREAAGAQEAEAVGQHVEDAAAGDHGPLRDAPHGAFRRHRRRYARGRGHGGPCPCRRPAAAAGGRCPGARPAEWRPRRDRRCPTAVRRRRRRRRRRRSRRRLRPRTAQPSPRRPERPPPLRRRPACSQPERPARRRPWTTARASRPPRQWTRTAHSCSQGYRYGRLYSWAPGTSGIALRLARRFFG